jgi:hypothetical protein
VRIDTVDEVNLHGFFYPGKGKRPACAILLNDLGEGHSLSDWNDLIPELQRLGMAVLTFDFRGGGDSTGVDPGFWNAPVNRLLVHGYRQGKPPDHVSRADFKSAYYPVLANDVAAARHFLDVRNDAGECNSARLVLIGAGEGATVGALWLASECFRFRTLDTKPERLNKDPEGPQTVAAVWLSLSPTLAKRPVPVTDWLRHAERKARVATAYLYGDGDKTGAAFARRCLEVAEPRKEDRKFTAAKPVPDTDRVGTDLLGAPRQTTPLIAAYLKNLLEETPEPEWQTREIKEQTYYWVFPGTRPELAKKKGEWAVRLLPLRVLGLP